MNCIMKPVMSSVVMEGTLVSMNVMMEIVLTLTAVMNTVFKKSKVLRL